MFVPLELFSSLSLTSWRSVFQFGDSPSFENPSKVQFGSSRGVFWLVFFCCAKRLCREFLCLAWPSSSGTPSTLHCRRCWHGILGADCATRRSFSIPAPLLISPSLISRSRYWDPSPSGAHLGAGFLPPRGRQMERLKGRGTAADILPQNCSHQRLVSLGLSPGFSPAPWAGLGAGKGSLYPMGPPCTWLGLFSRAMPCALPPRSSRGVKITGEPHAPPRHRQKYICL